ncbi:hypothetical protein [Escherichia coli]|uniref:Uncharacterized protein n=1 Tax=Escherichia coli TaxID=562 RepID=A0A7D7PEZ9_ECOLX|nr:hypothetical protein [Escherichia coli]MCF7420957.1 hypothetical protein [Escherichia coli]QMM47721.1 hypothetical protein HVX07_08030 [Escherichia coli]QMS37024.1 hypothetical protein HVV39_02880 [Escherichia coli]
MDRELKNMTLNISQLAALSGSAGDSPGGIIHGNGKHPPAGNDKKTKAHH